MKDKHFLLIFLALIISATTLTVCGNDATILWVFIGFILLNLIGVF